MCIRDRTGGDIDVTNGDIDILADNKKLNIGASSDLQLYHDGSNSYINIGTGAVHKIKQDNFIVEYFV